MASLRLSCIISVPISFIGTLYQFAPKVFAQTLGLILAGVTVTLCSMILAFIKAKFGSKDKK